MPALLAAGALLVVSHRGTYVSPDSLAYVGTARNLVDGRGYTTPPGSTPVSNFPPLYPLVLAAVGALGPDPLTVARFLGPVLFGLTVLTVGLLVRRITGSLPLAVAAQLLLVSATDLLAYHSAALSEPLFLLVALLALVAVGAALRSDGPGLILVAGALAGLATVARYVGLAVIVAGAAAFALRGTGRRWVRAVTFAAISLAPLVGWLAWVGRTEGRASNRTAVLHAPDADYFLGGIKSAARWFVPGSAPWAVRAAAAAVVVALLVGAWWRSRRADRAGTAGAVRSRASLVPLVLALFAGTYLLALVADRWLFEVTGRLDARFLLPVHVVAVVLAMAALARPGREPSVTARLGLALILTLQLGAGGVWVYDAATDASVRPGGFTAPAWRHSGVIEMVRNLPPSAAVFSNQPDALWFHTGREAEPIPEKNAFLTGKPNHRYDAELDVMRAQVGADGAIVYFTASPARRVFLPTAPELAGRLQLEEVVRDDVGVLYRAP